MSFVSAVGKSDAQPSKNEVNDRIGVPPTRTKIRPEQVRRTIALVVDDLTLSFTSVHFVRRALRKFVKEQVREGDLIAIIRASGGVGALQQFTFDKRQLLAAIDKLRWNPQGTGGIGAFAAIEATPLEQARANGVTISDEQIEAEKNRIISNNQFRENTFLSGSLGAIAYVIRGMRELPGRKSLMLFSDGFSLVSRTRNGQPQTSRILEPLRELIDLANRSSVVIYSLDARGLQTLGFSAADDTSGLSVRGAQQRLDNRRAQLFNTQGGLKHISQQTGGFAIINNNDLNDGIEKILDDQSYYLLSYEPDSDTFDSKTRRFNKIKVKVKRKGVRVRYRSGFFGVSDEKRKSLTNQTQTPAQKTLNAISSPFAVNEINLSLNTVFKSNGKDSLSLNSFVHINSKDLKFIDGPNDSKKVVFDALAFIFGDNGVPARRLSKTYTVTFNKNLYEKVLKKGLVHYFTFPIKKPGHYQMRVAIRDHATNKVGSASQFITIPKLKKRVLTLSGLSIASLDYAQWDKAQKTGATITGSDPFRDISLRQFKRGTVLTYGFEIYNAKHRVRQKPQLEIKTRVFYDGKPLHEGKDKPIDLSKQTNLQNLSAFGAINLGTSMQPGDYVLQVVVRDKLAKKKHQTATQFIQFEIVE